jgi:hypothetical protein
MIYANLVSCRVLVSLKEGAHIYADDELMPILAVEGYVESAGDGYMRLQTHAVHTNYQDSTREEGEEPMELTLNEAAILLVQLLEEGDTIETEEEDDDEEEEEDDSDE